ncbi:HNH endonuclease family protein [Domibacillus sp. DTU_2020_1001157_1_SI_ALB_TIR_016]|uniref:HNH endonuclease family protein n=1 Tax=Domibacillus sp. DTU_2020_1001157_1_SI_ALB_TIR_016 TaxID=3077789 RepID=UPI0028E51D49|nr:HNH endonuclease family protein [Domibacillus sp. DTU_2020_1001157_1_SI_ALB_TIR_016]WNS82404.1 HNH endonuclease family protein [Domibacillus sp. DTU_2020_1001157_1_SI_ALB_TIR_016]
MLRRHVCEYRTAELDAIFSNLVNVENEDIVRSVKEKLSKYLPTDNEFRDKFSKYSFKGNENRAKYALERFEYDLINDQGEYILSSGDELHLEHIIPQKITTKKSKEEFGDWEKYLGSGAKEAHKEYVNRIGNLTLLAKSLNIVASNNPFEDKVKEYQKSNIQLTKKVIALSEFKFPQVEKRSNELANKAVQLWRF